MIRLSIILTSITLLTFAMTQSLSISLALSAVALIMFSISKKKGRDRRALTLFEAMPEIIDNVISGIQSGLSLNETLIGLGERGPEPTRSIFSEFGEVLRAGATFEDSISKLQDNFGIRAADQFVESLIFAKNLGGTELLSLLRQLGDFIRQDLSLRREIQAKQGWIRNSAHLSAAAPWILLLLLSVQPTTASAFSTPMGILILTIGVLMTAIAYLWMGWLSRLPQPKRIFGSQI
jgi:tight adherence protein B